MDKNAVKNDIYVNGFSGEPIKRWKLKITKEIKNQIKNKRYKNDRIKCFNRMRLM